MTTKVAYEEDSNGVTGFSDCTGSSHVACASQKTRLNFHDENRTAHLQALYEWLPERFHHAPRIDWTQVPSQVIGYLVLTVGYNPEAPFLALAVGSMVVSSVSNEHMRVQAIRVNTLLKDLRKVCSIDSPAQLTDKQIWTTYVTTITLAQNIAHQLVAYWTLSEYSLRHYLDELDEEQRNYWKSYALPPLPRNFLNQYNIREIRDMASRKRRKEQTDVLVPLYPMLVQLIQFRKQAAQRLLQAFYEARKHVEAGEIGLPYSFVLKDTIPVINRDARTVAEVEIEGKPVNVNLTLWDRCSWVLSHRDRYSLATLEKADTGLNAYSPERNSFFLQCNSPEEDLLWIGEIVKYRLLQKVDPASSLTEEDQKRVQFAIDLGVREGFTCERSGLLSPGENEVWLSLHHRPNDMLFEPVSLYRGVLYGTALATLALTNGSRLAELLQVSDDRWDTIAVDQLKDGKPTGKQTTLIVQPLLPKGSRTDAQRQLFLMSKQSVRLLKEIYEGLVEAHGEVPVVSPFQDGSKYEHLCPERYLFQWDISTDGRLGVLSHEDVSNLLRFVLHGLELTTATGKPIRVSSHLLRHVTATHARYYQNVPPEAIALLLHHRMERDQSAQMYISAATKYYTEKPERQRLALLGAMQLELDEISATYAMRPLSECDLEQMNDDMRAVFERWGTILPTALGFCGCVGLCIRGENRALCIGCPFLVVDLSRMDAALKWRNVYTRQADELEAEGNYLDARQKRRLVRQLDDHINVMRLQMQAEADGRVTPFVSSLPVLTTGGENQ